jgi:hypothetical protein
MEILIQILVEHPLTHTDIGQWLVVGINESILDASGDPFRLPAIAIPVSESMSVKKRCSTQESKDKLV